jgi:hypothetical protein
MRWGGMGGEMGRDGDGYLAVIRKQQRRRSSGDGATAGTAAVAVRINQWRGHSKGAGTATVRGQQR